MTLLPPLAGERMRDRHGRACKARLRHRRFRGRRRLRDQDLTGDYPCSTDWRRYFSTSSPSSRSASAFMVISARNPVHSVLFLILTFFNAAGLFLLTGAEFLAMILLVVYVGAVAVLFLFVVMMLDIDFAELKSGALQYAPIGALIGLILAAELIVVHRRLRLRAEAGRHGRAADARHRRRAHNTAALGDILYTRLRLLLPDRRPGAAGRHDRRDRADAAPQAGRQAPDRSPRRWRARRRPRSRSRKSRRGRASDDDTSASRIS